MKRRHSFVTNSSSASFIIQKEHLTILQIHQIFNAKEVCMTSFPDFDYPEEAEGWWINDDGNSISGYTTMDNFDFREFLIKIGIPEEHINYDHDNGGTFDINKWVKET
jgi:hypothetical protein